MQAGHSAMDYWFAVAVLQDQRPELIDSMYKALGEEKPPILSVVGERTCNLQCAHCIFQAEPSSKQVSEAGRLTEATITVVRQMGPDPIVVHEGRIFRPWHLDWLTAIREARKDSLIGMIDNGTFLNHKNVIRSSGFSFDWLDISLDGPEEIHNLQRKSKDAYRVAVKGIENAREFLVASGKVTSLFTLTSINHASILETSHSLPSEISEWHISTLSPARPEIANLTTSIDEFEIAWQQTVAAAKERQLYFRIYVNDEIKKLIRVVGADKFRVALESAKVADVALFLEIDGVKVIYYPTSIVSGEEFIVDADAHLRLPYSIAYTLEELHRGRSRFGEEIGKYTVGPITVATNCVRLLEQSASQWKEKFGLAALKKEIEIFKEISR